MIAEKGKKAVAENYLDTEGTKVAQVSYVVTEEKEKVAMESYMGTEKKKKVTLPCLPSERARGGREERLH